MAQIALPGLEVLLDHWRDVCSFVKDREGRFVRCNRAFATLLRAQNSQDVVGLRDVDFFPRSLADSYMVDDAVVIKSAAAIVDKAELVRTPQGSIDWYHTTKLPIVDARGEVLGIAGFTRDIRKTRSNEQHFLYWAPVLESIIDNYADRLSTASLAAKVSLSVSQFDRRFKRRFLTTPRKYITNVRINAACQLLASTELPIAAIALQTGFYDQSHFTNHFTRTRGISPSQYRRKYVWRWVELTSHLGAARADFAGEALVAAASSLGVEEIRESSLDLCGDRGVVLRLAPGELRGQDDQVLSSKLPVHL